MAINHTYMDKDGLITSELTPIKAIVQKCKECSNFSYKDREECNIKDCALWPFRLGRTGNKRKPLTEEQKQKLKDGKEQAKNR